MAKEDSISKTSSIKAWNEFLAGPISFYNTLEEICPGTTDELNSIYGLTEELAKAVMSEYFDLEGFKSTLRHYQKWGVKYILHQGRVLLGDEVPDAINYDNTTKKGKSPHKKEPVALTTGLNFSAIAFASGLRSFKAAQFQCRAAPYERRLIM